MIHVVCSGKAHASHAQQEAEPALPAMSRMSVLGCRITHCPLGKSRPSVPPTCMPQRCSFWSSRLGLAHLFWMLAQASHRRCSPYPTACLRLPSSTGGPLHRRSDLQMLPLHAASCMQACGRNGMAVLNSRWLQLRPAGVARQQHSEAAPSLCRLWLPDGSLWPAGG